MKPIDVRLTLTPEAFEAVLARLDSAPPGNCGFICREAADAMKRCAMYQREFRDAVMRGANKDAALNRAADARKLFPLHGD